MPRPWRDAPSGSGPPRRLPPPRPPPRRSGSARPSLACRPATRTRARTRSPRESKGRRRRELFVCWRGRVAPPINERAPLLAAPPLSYQNGMIIIKHRLWLINTCSVVCSVLLCFVFRLLCDTRGVLHVVYAGEMRYLSALVSCSQTVPTRRARSSWTRRLRWCPSHPPKCKHRPRCRLRPR